MSEQNKLMDAFVKAGGDRSVLTDPETAHLFANGHKILSAHNIEGIAVNAKETAAGIDARVIVNKGVRIKKPVQLCFGVLHRKGIQEINMDVTLEQNSSAHFIAHCIFPNAQKVKHIMHAVIDIKESAQMKYSETHYHGQWGGIEVVPKAEIKIGRGGRYSAEFTLTSGRVGRLDMDYAVEVGENAVTELIARIFGHACDDIRIKEKASLSGKNSRSLIKTRVALEDESVAHVTGITDGNAEGARGHVDCMEIVKDRAVANAVPIVSVSNPLAKVTHEAAIGSVDKEQMETLMAHGLSPDEAVDIIVRGVLK